MNKKSVIATSETNSSIPLKVCVPKVLPLWTGTNTTAAEILCCSLKTFLKDRVKGFSTEESAVIKATEEGNHILAVIVFEDLNSDDSPKLPPLVKYKIRMLSDFGMFASDSLFNVGPAPVHKINQFKYFANGFIYLQDILEQLIIAEGTGTDINKLPVMYMQMMPAPCFVKDKFLETFLPYLSICIIMCWMYEFAMIVKFIVDAKNRYMKISLYHLCVNNDLQWIAWFIDCIVPLWCTSAALTIILKLFYDYNICKASEEKEAMIRICLRVTMFV
ncbi:ATP-binding cassette sub-family A member 2-like [Lycorma delicatula]|uniref:ATP-binding cassette sub-family A member 2-like n=1 Tax=Lycorma delicatula TaxID=130591 RepID=UPI003F516E63